MDEVTREHLNQVVKYLCENHHPHTTIIVECNWWEMLGWIEAQTITEHIRD